VLVNLDWKIHEGGRVLLRYGRACAGFTVTSGPEFHGG
jgi:hypothetical protein